MSGAGGDAGEAEEGEEVFEAGGIHNFER
jgi:hypothetical protein